SGTSWVLTTLSSAASPWGFARDRSGNLYYSDYLNKVIRRLSPDGTNWVSDILVGTPGTFGGDDGTNGDARCAAPRGLAVDTVSNLYLGESWAYTVRKISPVDTNWVVATIAGTTRLFGGADGANGDALFGGPAAVVLDSAGDLFVADPFNQAIRKVTPVGTN